MSNEEKPNLYNIFLKVGRIEGQIKEMSKKLDTVTKEHGDDIEGLQKVTNQFIGKVSIVGSIAGVVGAMIVAAFSHFLKN